MKQYLLLAGVSILLALTAKSQNLVPNPSFETQSSCPSNNLFTAASWYNPNTASPDYFHPCGTGFTVPPNVLFGPQSARTGSAFAGAGWYGLGGGWYDYMQVQLISPMVANTVYSVSMWVVLADGVTKASDDIGIYISSTPFKSATNILPAITSVTATTPANFGVFTTLTPQIKCPNNNFITDVNNWTLVSGTYTATGGESAITIGCFEPWATTGTSVVAMSGNDRCYYHIDDVSVEAISSVTVQPPSQPVSIAGSASACAYAIQEYSIAPVPGATSYSWNLPGGWTGSSTTHTIAVTTDSASGTLSVTALNQAGASPSQTFAVTITNVQANVTLVNSVLQTTVAGTYQWVDCNNSYSVISTGSSTYAPSQSGSYALIITHTGCADTSACMHVGVLPLQPGPITGALNLCPGISVVYSVSPVAGASSYSWNLPSGWTGASTNNTIAVIPTTASGTLSVAAVNQTGASSSQTIGVTVTNIQASVTQANSVLQTTVAGTYQWVDCNGNYSVVASGSSTFAPAKSGSYAVIITQNGCVDTSACSGVMLAPAQPGLIAGTATLCAGSTVVYSVSPVAGAASYSWNLPSGWSGTSITNSIVVKVNASSGTLSVTAGNPAGASSPQWLSITVNSVTALITQTSGVLYASGAASYQWVDCANGHTIVAAGMASYSPLQSGSYAVIGTFNGCADTSACLQVNVSTTGLADLAKNRKTTVFPNPADQFISVTIKERTAPVTVRIEDHSGRLVHLFVYEAGETISIGTASWEPGLYMLNISSKDQTPEVHKIVVSR